MGVRQRHRPHDHVLGCHGGAPGEPPTRKPCVLTVHEYFGRSWFWVERPWRAAALRLYERHVVMKRYSAWHAASNATTGDLVAGCVPAREIDTIHFGVDGAVWNPLVEPGDLPGLLGFPEASRIFLFTGRPGATKGTGVLLEAIALTAGSVPDDVRGGSAARS